MFKKFKDKLAEEVKSSPQRIQQFAQAAQAAVNSASSSISDITNNDLFSIGESETKLNNRGQNSRSEQQANFQPVPLQTPLLHANVDAMEGSNDYGDSQRHRKLSNSSFASDVSFKLPSYESPAMYHLQSDMDVSASEAEDRFSSPGSAFNLDHVTKEQLFAAYRRTRERYGKYRSRYTDLARHYKALERDNAKARSVLVETQDKALRRISELREQCSLEQSAKAHLESALRVEIDEKNMKIDSLTTKVKLLQENNVTNVNCNLQDVQPETVSQLIDLTDEKDGQSEELHRIEVNNLNNKIEKMEQLLNKYKDSVKSLKDRNSQLTTEMQLVNNNLESVVKEKDELKITAERLIEAQHEIQTLKENNEDLQNKVNAFDFDKVKKIASLETDLKQAQDEIVVLNSRIEVFNKREEEYAISLAENKLSIHKELESKEAEIKSLKDSLSACKTELDSLKIIIKDYKDNLSHLEEEKTKLVMENTELFGFKEKFAEIESEFRDFKIKCDAQDALNNKSIEEIKCLELLLKQEKAEKLAIIDIKDHLDNKNKQISEENIKKSAVISKLEKELRDLSNSEDKTNKQQFDIILLEKNELINEVTLWKDKFIKLELEIQDERVELVKLQSEIEKLIRNHELIQSENSKLHDTVIKLTSENSKLQSIQSQSDKLHKVFYQFKNSLKEISHDFASLTEETKLIHNDCTKQFLTYLGSELYKLVENVCKKHREEIKKQVDVIENLNDQISKRDVDYNNLKQQYTDLNEINTNLSGENIKLENEKTKLNTEIYETNEKHKFNLETLNSVQKENELLKLNVSEISDNIKSIEFKYSETVQLLNNMKEENNVLYEKCERLKQEKENIYEKVLASDKKLQEYESNLKILEDKLSEKEILEANFSELENDLEQMKINNQSLQNINTNLEEQMNVYSDKKLQEYENNLKILQDKLSEKEILEANVSILENELEQINRNYESLQNVNTKLEEQLNAYSAQFTTDSNNDADNTVLNDVVNIQHKQDSSSQSANYDHKLTTLQSEFDSLKAEKNILLSEIEGLQLHLQKVSKDNTSLNDQLREIMGNSELSSVTEKRDNEESLSLDILNLRQELTEEKQKSNDLFNENSMLVEKNLELQDCIKSHHLNVNNIMNKNAENSSNKELEIIELQEKYDGLLQIKMQLESKLAEVELLGRSGDNNESHLMERYEKLKLTNEKLERRLDEALVSLRHFQALEESTELEYLRNVLYEYLTGPGLHSETLAKVLSAVVKFDDKQTQLVIQKEKERQGLLRQLGLL